jgi:hypothetical protein
MPRFIDDARDPEPVRGVSTLDRALSRDRDVDVERILVWRDRIVTVSPAEAATLRSLGTFRTVALTDLATHRYGGDHDQCIRDLRRLERQHFVEAQTLPGRRGGRETPLLTLTREGRGFTADYLAREGQRVYCGLARPKERAHAAALYRMAVKETERLAARGATVRRVVLDAELKGRLAAARNRPGAGDPARRTVQAALDLQLHVVDGAVRVPDLRLEYETRDGSMGRVDLELATEHYKPGQVAAKAAAGFTIYAPAGQTGRLTAALQDRGLAGRILSL